MSFPSLSAGTGPAAALLAGAFFYFAGNQMLGLGLMLAGIGLSAFWALRFK
jgi:uncharacterized membrane protein YccC